MSNTHSYLTRRLGTLRAHAANTEHDIARLQKKHADQLAELAEVEAALAAVEGLTESEPDDDAIAESYGEPEPGATEAPDA